MFVSSSNWIVFSTPSCIIISYCHCHVRNFRLSECTAFATLLSVIIQKKKTHQIPYTHKMIYSSSENIHGKSASNLLVVSNRFEHVACIKRALYALNNFFFIPSCICMLINVFDCPYSNEWMNVSLLINIYASNILFLGVWAIFTSSGTYTHIH